ncbi:MAG: fasciclin domain-containing protein [Cyclobacteriaceae bacterium]|nr:fasciclin domain-containing protein [Cyclobacteriaceae bacterium]
MRILSGKILTTLLFTASLVLIGLNGCKKEDEGPTQTIWEIVEGNADLSQMMTELQTAGLDTELKSSAGNYTLFVPSNLAMNNLLATLGLEDFTPIKAVVTQAVLEYHIANQKLLLADMVEGNEITTQQGEKIAVIAGQQLQSGASKPSGFEQADLEATNGVVHIIDVVLVPPSIGAIVLQTLGTVAQPIFLGANFSVLAEAIVVADGFAIGATLPSITSLLINQTAGVSYTVFAPVDGVFALGGITVGSFTGQEWYGLILNHIVAGNYGNGGSGQTAFSPGMQLDTQAGFKLTVLAIDAPLDATKGITSGVVIDSNGDITPEAQIAVENAAPAGNGTVHALAGILSPN